MWRKTVTWRTDNAKKYYVILFVIGFIMFKHDWDIHRAWVPFMSPWLYPHPHHLYIGIIIMVFSFFMTMSKLYNESRI